MFQHVAHYNKNMEKMMLEMLTFKLQQKHEVEKFELIEKCQYVIQDIQRFLGLNCSLMKSKPRRCCRPRTNSGMKRKWNFLGQPKKAHCGIVVRIDGQNKGKKKLVETKLG